ncbi:hypothetical protein MMC21_005434 [Puttea exsequens]|nr:hypothetical protein [Puttea exsequens]
MIQMGLETEEAQLERAYSAIRYRMGQVLIADSYLVMMEKRCHEFDTYGLLKRAVSVKYSQIKRMIYDCDTLFPGAVKEQAGPFHEGVEYLIAAFDAAGLPLEDMQAKLDSLVAKVDVEL